MRVIFLGTPDFAVKALENLYNSTEHEVIAVVTQLDKMRGRGHNVTFSPVKQFAKDHGIDVLQYKKIRVDGVNDLKHLNPDIMVTCAYGQILSQEIIDIPKYGIINIHASLLPKYRGSAPINWAVINGESQTGVTLMKTEIGIDTGDMLMSRIIPVDDNDTAGDVFEKLSVLGADMIVEGLNQIQNGSAIFTPQNESEATHCSMFTKEMGKIDFSKNVREIDCFVRGMTPFPSAFIEIGGNKIKVFEVSQYNGSLRNSECGVVLASDKNEGIVISCNGGAVCIESLQYPNSKRVSAKDFLNGRSIEVGEKV